MKGARKALPKWKARQIWLHYQTQAEAQQRGPCRDCGADTILSALQQCQPCLLAAIERNFVRAGIDARGGWRAGRGEGEG